MKFMWASSILQVVLVTEEWNILFLRGCVGPCMEGPLLIVPYTVVNDSDEKVRSSSAGIRH